MGDDCHHPHHHHGHAHAHSQAAAGNLRRLGITLALSVVYLIAEVAGGLMTQSLALLADAGHMLSDVAALGLSLFAIWIAGRPASPRQTFGYYRAEILAALINGSTLIAISLWIFVEAVHRLRQPPEVAGGPMMAVALGGLLVNLASLWILGGSDQHNLNVRGAWLHVLTDALGSVGTIVAAGLVWAFGCNWADPLASFVIGLLVIYSAWQLVAESVAVLMEMVPRGVNPDAVRDAMLAVPGVVELHDLHIWTITTGLESLSAHVVIADRQPPDALLTQLREALHHQFGIAHVTIQVESGDFPAHEHCG